TAVQTELLTMLSGSNQQQTLGDFAQQFLNTAEPSWEAGSRVAIKRGSGRLITLELRSHQYTGGAHALPLVSYLNIDRDTGQVVNLSDLLKEDAQDRFWEAARQAHQRWLDSEPMGIRPIAEFTESDNVFIGPQTVELRYNVYTLGPYAIGQPSLEIPCEEVREYLQPAWATLCKPV
ncbi:MAG: RsiV family protein, partial [Nevskiales bacterium]